jgi:hypothetical protein
LVGEGTAAAEPTRVRRFPSLDPTGISIAQPRALHITRSGDEIDADATMIVTMRI